MMIALKKIYAIQHINGLLSQRTVYKKEYMYKAIVTAATIVFIIGTYKFFLEGALRNPNNISELLFYQYIADMMFLTVRFSKKTIITLKQLLIFPI